MNRNENTRQRRHVSFEGIMNFRDLGGYKTKEGRRIKWNKLYRSGQLSELTPKDQGDFRDLEIQLICDFRWEEEQNREPTRIKEAKNMNILNLPIKTGSFKSFFEKKGVDQPTSKDMFAVMQEIYRNFVNKHALTYAHMFQQLRHNDKGTLIHCSAGKDRTGFGSAMILSVLGVDKDTIMEDYLLSTRYFSADAAMAVLKSRDDGSRFSFNIDVLRPVYEVYPEYLQSAFIEIEKKFGSIDQYVDQALGVSQKVRRELQDQYLE